MIPINGRKVLKDFKGFVKVSDLIYFEGPLLSHFISPNGDHSLFYWCDVDESFNRWIVVRVDPLLFQMYLRKELTLRELILNPPDGLVYMVQCDDQIHFSSFMSFILPRFQ